MKWNMLWDLSVHHFSPPFGYTCCFDKSELETCLCFPVSENPQSTTTTGVVLSLSYSSNNSVRCCPPTPRPSTQATHQLLKTTCPESSCSVFYLLLGFFGFILTLGMSASKNSSSSSFPISTYARDSPTGSMSSPIGATSRFRDFVGLTNALLYHLRFPTAGYSSQNNVRHRSHCVFLSISLLDSNRP